jgi:hypothetical protein
MKVGKKMNNELQGWTRRGLQPVAKNTPVVADRPVGSASGSTRPGSRDQGEVLEGVSRAKLRATRINEELFKQLKQERNEALKAARAEYNAKLLEAKKDCLLPAVRGATPRPGGG